MAHYLPLVNGDQLRNWNTFKPTFISHFQKKSTAISTQLNNTFLRNFGSEQGNKTKLHDWTDIEANPHTIFLLKQIIHVVAVQMKNIWIKVVEKN